MITSKKSIIAVLSCFLIFPSSLLADQISKKEIVSEQLDCISRQLQHQGQMAWGDICYSGDEYPDGKTRQQKIADALEMEEHVRSKEEKEAAVVNTSSPSFADRETQSVPESLKEVPVDDSEAYKKTLKVSPKKKMMTLNRRKSLQKFDLGFETYSYHYHEPGVQVKDKGQFYGVYTSYTFRLSENKPIKSISDILSDENKVNMFRIEGSFAAGLVDYDGSGTFNDISDHVVEIRGLAGYDVPMDERSRFTPFSGIGYRYLFDNFSALPARTVDGVNYLSGYDREQAYIYVPLGLEYEHQFDSPWTVGGTLEYDILVQGTNKSHLEDSVDSSGTNAGYSTANFIQRSGRGIRFSLKLAHETEKIDFAAEPFFRYWRIEDSSIDNGFIEPTNNTRELGVKLGIRY